MRQTKKFATIPSMAKRNERGRAGKGEDGERQRLRIMLGLWEWSGWSRQVFRGVQGFAHSRPEWQLYVVTGQENIAGNFNNIQWDGILTHVLSSTFAVFTASRGAAQMVQQHDP